MTNRHPAEAKFVPDGRPTGACPCRPIIRDRRRAPGRAVIIEEMKTRERRDAGSGSSAGP